MLTYFLNERRRLKLVGSGAFSPGNFSDFNSLKFLFVGLVVQKGYWPVPFSSDEALRIGGLFIKVNFHVVVDMSKASLVNLVCDMELRIQPPQN